MSFFTSNPKTPKCISVSHLVDGVYVLDLLLVAGVGARAEDEPDPAARLPPRARHEAAGGVVEHGAHVDADVVAARDGLAKHLHDVLALDVGAAEALGPLDQVGGGQAVLLAREREGEAEREQLVRDLPAVHEVREAGGDVVEQALAGA